MKAKQIKENIHWVGVKDWNLREFHGYATPYGSTYNSYIIMAEKIALIDGVKACLSPEMIRRVQSVVEFSKIDYLVVNHVEMDHSGNVPEIMKLAPQAKIVTDAAGKMALEAHFDTTGWRYEIVKTGDSLSLGNKTLEFMATPMLHWPDSMMTYLREDKVLFSNDGFGQHIASDGLLVNEQPMDVVMREAQSYYANILYPFAAQAEKALATAGDLRLDIEMIAPSHGCIWNGKNEVSTIISAYAKWASGEDAGKAVIVYDSMWGATAAMANEIMAVFQDAGIPVSKHCLTVENVSEIMPKFLDAKYICIGNPTLNNQLFPRVAGFLTYMKGLAPRNKLGLAFGSYGWKPGVVNQIKAVFDELGWKTTESFEAKYTPKAETLESLRKRVAELIEL